MEREFQKQQYVVGHERMYLANALNLTEAQVRKSYQLFHFQTLQYAVFIMIILPLMIRIQYFSGKSLVSKSKNQMEEATHDI